MTSRHVVIKYDCLKISFTNDNEQYLAPVETITRNFCSSNLHKLTNEPSPRRHYGLDTAGTSEDSGKALSPKYWKRTTREDSSKDHYYGINKVDE